MVVKYEHLGIGLLYGVVGVLLISGTVYWLDKIGTSAFDAKCTSQGLMPDGSDMFCEWSDRTSGFVHTTFGSHD